MGIRKLSEDIMLVDLPSDELKRAEELKAVNEVVSNNSDSNVIMDFSGVEIINSWNVSNLLILQNMLAESGHQLILCAVRAVTKCIFVVAGLGDVFTFADNRRAAEEAIGNTSSSTSAPGQ
ncbi:MAG: STAS domain-containing protein [Planctomycetota bacterium]|jgi:anti-anti-sigma regulatory factor